MRQVLILALVPVVFGILVVAGVFSGLDITLGLPR